MSNGGDLMFSLLAFLTLWSVAAVQIYFFDRKQFLGYVALTVLILIALPSILLWSLWLPYVNWGFLACQYGAQRIAAENLRIAEITPDLVISNGDVFSMPVSLLFHLAKVALLPLSMVCCFAPLWILDRIVFSGRGTRFILSTLFRGRKSDSHQI